MDAWMQKHRMRRWMGRVFVVLTLAASCGVQAAVETKDPLPVSSWHLTWGIGGSFPSAEAACFSYSLQLGNEYTYLGTSPYPLGSDGNMCANTSGLMDCVYSLHGTKLVMITANPEIVCPTPTDYPTIPYYYRGGYVTNPCMCERTVPSTYKLELTPEVATIEPSKTYKFTAKVTDQDGNLPSQSVPVTVKVEVDPTSGGHDHGEPPARPKGSVSPASGNNEFQITFTSTEVSGTHKITATCEMCTNSPKTAKVDVKVDGLEIIPDSSFYTFVGDTNEHSKNHYLVPDASTVLRNIAISYRIEDKFWQLKKARRGRIGQYTYTPPSVLNVNDASLIWGGKFDIHGKWKGDHQAHKRGIVVDIRANQININNGAIPLQSFTNFQDMALEYYNAEAQVHCSDDGQDRREPTCIGNDGSQDGNRHLHVLLLGDDK